MGDLSDSGCDNRYGHGLVQAKDAYELLAEGNCGGDIGTDEGVGGCEQLYPEPNCEVDSDCDDKDTCSVNTCDNGQCVSTPQCASCGKSKVDVEITIDDYSDETTYDIMDASGSTIMEGSGWPANSVNSFWKCVASGTYTFTITDAYGDGICCSYGQGGHVVKANDAEVASGGQFGSSDTKTFQVGDAAPTTPAPVTPTPGPSSPTPPTDGTSTESSTLEPNPTSGSGSSAPNPPTVPTPGPSMTAPSSPTSPYPTQTPPTMFPTHTPPTPYPTEVAPTAYPTGAVPTTAPTTACGAWKAPCTKHSDCCVNRCNLNKNICRKK